MAQTTKKKNTSAPKRTTRQAAPTPPTPSPVPRTAGGLVCLLLALCVAVSYFDAQAVLLNHLHSVLTGLFGYGYWLWAPLLLAGGLFLLLHRERKAAGRVVCALLTPVLGGSLLHLLLAKPIEALSASALWTAGKTLTGGGVISGGMAELGKTYLSEAVFAILAVIGLLACIFVMLRTTPAQVAQKARERAAQRAEEAEEGDSALTTPAGKDTNKSAEKAAEKPASRRRKAQIDIPLDSEDTPLPEEHPLQPEHKPFFAGRQTPTPDEVLQPPKEAEPAPSPASAAEPAKTEAAKAEPTVTATDVKQATEEVSRQIEQELAEPEEAYQYPPITLLEQGTAGSFTEAGAEMRSNSKRLTDTLRSFGVDAQAGDVVRGPSVTRYEFTQPQGVKLSKITNLADDIALALGVGSVRVAPVPGKISAVGIEVPNRAVTPVRIRDVIESREFTGHKSAVAFAVGKDIGGNRIIGDIAKRPHVLIAGTTGSGKSVCTNSLIVSLLYKSTPEEVRFIMVDPKMVELAPTTASPIC